MTVLGADFAAGHADVYVADRDGAACDEGAVGTGYHVRDGRASEPIPLQQSDTSDDAYVHFVAPYEGQEPADFAVVPDGPGAWGLVPVLAGPVEAIRDWGTGRLGGAMQDFCLPPGQESDGWCQTWREEGSAGHVYEIREGAAEVPSWLLLLTSQGNGWAVTAEQETQPAWVVPAPESVPDGAAPPECLPPDPDDANADQDWYAPIYCEDYG